MVQSMEEIRPGAMKTSNVKVQAERLIRTWLRTCYLSCFPHSPSIDKLGSFKGGKGWDRHKYSTAQSTMLLLLCPFAHVFLAAWDTVLALYLVGFAKLNCIPACVWLEPQERLTGGLNARSEVAALLTP